MERADLYRSLRSRNCPLSSRFHILLGDAGIAIFGRYWEDFKIGEKFQTARRTIFESDVIQFCNLAWFNISMFFDDVYAKEETIYHERVVPGPFLIALAVGLFLKLGFYERTAISLLDIKNMRFLNSFKIGETMQVEVTILDKRETKNSDRGLLTLQFAVTRHDQTPIMTFEMVHLLKRK
jgi:acyl dehydratase